MVIMMMEKYKYHAWLVVNHFVHAEKFETFYKILMETARKQGIRLEKRTNVELLTEIDENFDAEKLKKAEKPDFVLFWDKDLNLCRHLENRGFRVLNNSRAIETCDDKNKTLLALEGHGIRMPKTIIAPKTFRPDQYPELDFLPEIVRRLGFPLVVKEAFGSFGFQVHLAHDLMELEKIVREIGTRPMQFQEFIRSKYRGKTADVRIHVVGREVVAAVLRTAHEGDFRANVTNGGKMEPYTPTEAQKALALRVCEILNTDFAGVDLLFDETDGANTPILCEVNTNAHFKNLFDATGVNVAEFIFKEILEKHL